LANTLSEPAEVVSYASQPQGAIRAGGKDPIVHGLSGGLADEGVC
jgi:hypothetical protein